MAVEAVKGESGSRRGVAMPRLLRACLWAAVGYVLGAGATALIGSVRFSSEVAITIGYFLGLVGWLLGVGLWEALARPYLGLPTRVDEGKGWRRYWRFNTDHKVVGIQYLITALFVFLLAGAFAMAMRYELAQPGMQLFPSKGAYNQIMSAHGALMIFVVILAIIGGFGNYFVPLHIGAEDMAFPVLNGASYWFIPPGVLAMLAAQLLGGWDTGWTGYPPLALTNASGQVLFNLGAYTLGFSSIVGSVNFLTTIIHLRAPGLHWGRLPMFVWSMLVTNLLILLFFPFAGMAFLMVLLDRIAGLTFFSPPGNPLLYQDIFWIFGHPEVYILVLPAFGVMLEILPVFARKPLFGYRWAVAGFLFVTIMSTMVWGHHMWTSGMSNSRLIPFMTMTELISIPTGLFYLSGLGTLWRARTRFTTPMLFAMGMLFNFLIGGLTGVFNADVPVDIHLHDTFFVVGHFHYTIMGGMVFALMAGLYYWFPKFSGRMYNETLGKIHFWWMFIAYNATFLPMFWLGMHGMNRRIADYLPYLAPVNMFVSISAFALGASMLLALGNFAYCWVRGKVAERDPWKAKTLEWSLPSPPPKENFPAIPEVVGDFYSYGEVRPDELPFRMPRPHVA